MHELIAAIEAAPEFGYDDEQKELNELLATQGFSWRWLGSPEKVAIIDAEGNRVYRPEFHVADGSPPTWYTNAQRGGAEQMGHSAFQRYLNWTLCAAWRVVPLETPEKQPVQHGREFENQVFLEVPDGP